MASGITKFFAIILVLILTGGAFFVGWFWANDWMFDKSPAKITPVIDGVIEKKEWMRSSYYNIPFYLDVNNDLDLVENKSNVDGWNYLSVAEDDDYYYIAVDLCSDRTNNKEGEWISFQLANRLPDTEGSKLAFSALEDYGYEYFFYNVSDDSVFEHEYIPGFLTSNYYDIPIVPETDLVEVLRGNVSGDYYDFWTNYDNKNFTGTSKFYDPQGIWLNGSFLDIHFGINITEKFPDEEISTFMASLIDMDLRYVLKPNLSASIVANWGDPAVMYFGVAEHGGMPGNISDLGYVGFETEIFLPSADSIYIGGVNLDHNKINASTGMFYFSIRGWNDADPSNPTDFEVQFDKLSLKFTTDTFGAILGNTIATGNYDIAYSYGPSENCIENHRQFEFKMAKAEFPVLDDEILYLIIGGYGTMALENSNYWLYPKYGYPLSPIHSSVDEFYDFLSLDMSIT
jgi:hypothetical protein